MKTMMTEMMLGPLIRVMPPMPLTSIRSYPLNFRLLIFEKIVKYIARPRLLPFGNAITNLMFCVYQIFAHASSSTHVFLSILLMCCFVHVLRSRYIDRVK